MPNWCENRLLVSGKEPDVEKLFDAIEGDGTVIDFEKIVPIPQEIKDLGKKTELFPGVYGRTREGAEQYAKDTFTQLNWQAENWGTKWNASFATRVTAFNGKNGSRSDELNFLTAWGPAEPIVRELHRQHPETSLVHFYREEGMCFSGEASYLNKHDSQLKDWQPDVPENVTYLEGEAYKKAYPEQFDEDDLEGYPIAGQGEQAGEQHPSSTGEQSMTNATENKEAEATPAAEVKLSKREQMAQRVERDVATVKGLLDVDHKTGDFTGGDGFVDATLLPGVTTDMIRMVDENRHHQVLVGTRAITEMSTAAMQANRELQKTKARINLHGKTSLEVDTTRGGDVTVRLREPAVNTHAGELKAAVTNFAAAVKALELDEAAEAAAK